MPASQRSLDTSANNAGVFARPNRQLKAGVLAFTAGYRMTLGTFCEKSGGGYGLPCEFGAQTANGLPWSNAGAVGTSNRQAEGEVHDFTGG